MNKNFLFSIAVVAVFPVRIGITATSENDYYPRMPPSELKAASADSFDSEVSTFSDSSALGYCSSNGGSHDYEYILNASYTKLTADTASVTVEIFLANPSNCSAGQSCPEYDNSPEHINAWIDWNGNQVFDSSENVLDVDLTGYLGMNYYGTMSTSTIISIPSDAVDTTWMRVNLGWQFDPNNPCESSWTWGDIVDRVVAPNSKVPVVSDIIVTGLPDANNPMTSDTSVAGVEKVKLEAVIEEAAGYTVTNVSWAGDVVAGSGNPYEYVPAAGTHGMKYVMCSITYENTVTHETWTDTRGRNFKLFFNKTGNDDGDNEPNWFEYWKSDAAVPNMNVAQYDASTTFYGYATGANIFLGPIAAGQHYSNPIVLNNTHFGTESFGGPTVKGIDSAAEIIAHELYHNWVSDQWNTGGIFNGQADSDAGVPCLNCDDDLSDDYETNTSHTDPDDKTDTYDLEHKKSFQYASYGDNEYMAMRTGNGARGVVIRDWANPGKQSDPAYGDSTSSDSTSSNTVGMSDATSVYAPVHAVLTGNYTNTGIDNDSDALYDSLRVSTELNVTTGGIFQLSARLKDQNGDEITWSNKRFNLNPGIQSIAVDFDGLAIRKYHVDGTYTVDIKLLDDEGLSVDEQHGTHTTANYSYNQFEQQDASFVGSYTDSASDTDGDGLYDALRITTAVNVATPKEYLVEGSLYDSKGQSISNVSTLVHLDIGSQTVALDFDGRAIHRNRVNGPYYLKYLSLSGSSQVDFGKAPYTTAAYNFSEFEKGVAEFNGGYSDYGNDSDKNGAYNALTVDVQLDVSVADKYTVTGWLYSTAGQIVMASNSVFLNTGTASVPLNFNGTSIYLHGVNGPYYLKYITLHNKNGKMVDTINQAYTTKAYAYTEFQESFVRATDYSDYGTDIDSDGKYDSLTVRMQISLADAGYSVVKARLMDNNGKEIGWAEKIVGPLEADTLGMVDLVFNGKDIYANGVNGPYHLNDLYMYHTGNPFEPVYIREAYTTAAYGYCEFGNCPPVAVAGPDETFECVGPNGAVISLDGSQSYDQDNDSLTYTWMGPFGTLVGKTVNPQLPIGVHDITLTVEDSNGGSDSDTAQITVQDTVAPSLNVTLSPDMLWPANHKMRQIVANVTMSDKCDSKPSAQLVSISSSEPDHGAGADGLSNDIQGAQLGTDDRNFSLRSERTGTGPGRKYTVTYSVQDRAGNMRMATKSVDVPHDKGKKNK